MDGTRVLTDPLLRTRVAHLRRRVEVDAAAHRDVDAVLVSHAHYDHLDRRSLEQVGRSTLVVVPRGLGGLLRRRGFEQCRRDGRRGARGRRRADRRGDARGAPRRPPVRSARAGRRIPHHRLAAPLLRGRHRALRRHDLPRRRTRTSPSSRSGAGARRWEEAGTSTRSEPPTRSRSSGPASPCRSTGGRTIRSISGIRVAPAFMRDPPAQFVRAAALAAPEVEVRVLQPGETLELDARCFVES